MTTRHEPEETQARRSLWRDGNFLTFWGGQTLAQAGTQITELAIPVLAVVLLNATELQVGFLNAAAVAAFLVVGLPAGAWIDRMRKRRVMITADLVRAVALSLLPLLWWLDVLAMWQLYAVALVLGIATVFFDVSYQSVIPSLVPGRQIAEANGKLEATRELANIGGPAVGGWLVGILTAPLAILATVGTYLVSAVALLLTRDTEEPRAGDDKAPIMKEIGEGLSWVFGNPLLRRIVGTTAVSNLFNTLSFTMLPIFLLRTLGFSVETMGVLLSLGAIGGLVGAVATPHIVKLLGEARSIPVSAIVLALVAVLLPLAASFPDVAFPLLVAQLFIGNVAILAYNITQVTFRQRVTPKRLLGRMNASVRFCVWGVMPIAALASGLLASAIGVVGTMWVGAAGQLLAALFVVTGPFWKMSELPDADARMGA
ncbi:MFS transporter [Agrococcus casei]|uniref:Major facilitator superfamily MFS_1 n=1 Tax=Agrococcus casei LMG 22410 TaxID=1255656 RepID=A0A1R4FTH4_9MICO|nr:MFS transporter [Agrococcus casei]SJM59228.1 major facilitator superfamily MFS_1 [Agrococcus casei LMG 22410]